MGDIGRVGIFEDVFLITERFKDKKVWLYGLNDETKRACLLLSFFDIPVEGFLIEQDYKERTGDEYLGKPLRVIGEDDSGISTFCIPVDIYGENINRLEEVYGRGDILFNVGAKRMILYGAGECGKKAIEFLKRVNGDIVFICDERFEDIENLDNYSVISPKEIFHLSPKDDYLIIVAINDEKVSEGLCELYRNAGFKCSYFNSVFFGCNYSRTIWMNWEGEYKPLFKTWCLRYMRNISRKKRIFLYSSDDDFMIRVIKRLKCLGYGFGRATFDIDCGGIKLFVCDNEVDEEYFLYREEKVIIWVLSGYEDSAKKVFKDVGKNFEVLYSINAPLKLEREYILDIHMGFGNKNTPQIISNHCKKQSIRLAILGDSTADVSLMAEKSWPEYLLEEATDNDIACELICAATCGYTSALDLIQLERDILPYKPNVVMGYTIVNERSLADREFGMTHIYQKSVFDMVNRCDEEISFFGKKRCCNDIRMGIHNRSAVELWIDNNRMMNAICAEFGIKYFAILPPVLFTKEPKSKIDQELLEYIRYDGELVSLIDSIKKSCEGYDWFCDLTEIFNGYDDETFIDNGHVVQEKNKVVAKEIMKRIMRGLQI